MKRILCVSLLATAIGPSATAQIDPDAARSWSVQNPIDSLLWTSDLGLIDQSRAIAPAGQLEGALATRRFEIVPDAVRDEAESFHQLMDPNWALLSDLGQNREYRVGLPLPEGGLLELVLSKAERRAAQRFTWYGQIAGVANSSVILVRHDDALRLIVRNWNPGGRTFEIRSTPAGHVFAEVNAGDEVCDGVRSVPLVEAFEAPGLGPGAGGVAQAMGAADPTNVIDVMVVLSDQSRAAYGSSGAFVADAFAMIADANVRVTGSGGPWQFRLCAAAYDLIQGYSERGDIGQDLYEIAYPVSTPIQPDGEPSPIYTTTDTFTDAIQATRNTFRPDLVALLVESGGTGIAFVPEGTPTNESSGYSVTRRSSAISNGTFAHELGHNMGACHNANASAPGCEQGINGTDRGIERWADVPDGICGGCEDTEYRTTMAYAVNSPSIRVPRYSVFGLTQTLEGSFGDATVNLWADDAQVILTFGVTRPYVSNYRIGSAQIWTSVGGLNEANGTWQSPVATIRTANQLVTGGAAEGTIKAYAGTYEEVAANGGVVTLSNGCVIQPINGPIEIR